MILSWIRSIVGRNEAVEQGAIEEAKRQKESKLTDVAQEALRSNAAEHSADLTGLVKYGWSHVKRRKFKSLVRRKVWGAVKHNFGGGDDDIVDEITERIADVAEVDPYYQKIFENKGEQ